MACAHSLPTEDPVSWEATEVTSGLPVPLLLPSTEPLLAPNPPGRMTHPAALSLPALEKAFDLLSLQSSQALHGPQGAAQVLLRAGSLDLRVQALTSSARHGRGALGFLGDTGLRQALPVP